MTDIHLPNNRLILNGHRILNMHQLFIYLSKRLKSEIANQETLIKILGRYEKLQIAIWHSNTFLQEEKPEIQKEMIALLKRLGEVKITGKDIKNQ